MEDSHNCEKSCYKLKINMKLEPRTFNIERTTIFILPFSRGLVIQLNGSAMGVLKHHYISKRIRKLLIGNSRFLIHNSLRSQEILKSSHLKNVFFSSVYCSDLFR